MKKIISFALSAALMMSVMSPFASLGYAEEEQTAQSAAVQVEAASEAESQAEQAASDAGDESKEQPASETASEVTSEAASEQQEETASKPGAASEEQATESAPASEEQPASASSAAPEEEQAAESAPAAEEATEESEAVQAAIAAMQALPGADAVAAMSEEELNALNEALAAAAAALDALNEEEYTYLTETYAGLCEGMQAVLAALESRTQSGVETQSMRPMKEYTGLKLELDGYSREEYKAFRVDELMKLLQDQDGNPVEVDLTNATTVWFRFGDYSDEYREEIHQLNNNETVNLWRYWDYGTHEYSNSPEEPMKQNAVMIVGSGNQVDDANNTRYVFKETLYTNDKPKNLDGGFSLIMQDQDSEEPIQLESNDSTNDFEGMGIPGIQAVFIREGGYDPAETWYVKWDHSREKHLQKIGYSVTLYDAESYKADPENAQEVALEDDEKIPFTAAEGKWVVVIQNAEQKVIGRYGFSISLQDRKPMEGSLFVYKEEQSTTEKCNCINFATSAKYYCELNWENEEAPIQRFGMSYSSPYSSIYINEDEVENLYLSIQNGEKIKGIYDTNENGRNNNLKSQILIANDAQLPYGYKLNLQSDRSYNYFSFTIVMEDDTLNDFSVNVYINHKSEPTDPSYSNSFSINRLYDTIENKSIRYTSVSSISGMEIDSYYSGYSDDVSGYQLIMTPTALTEEQMKALVPGFYTDNSGDKVYSSGSGSSQPMISGKTNLQNALWLDLDKDGKNETVQFTVVTPDDQTKNYMVTFATQQQGSDLFLPGPEERLVNLDISNNFAHDVLVMNTGAEDLEIESVSIENAQNVAIDSYWTIQPGSVLNGLTTLDNTYGTVDDDTQYKPRSSYATTANMAKVRLIPNGSGAIGGTLVVKAKNGTERRVKLTGTASLPGFTTDQITEAVKYVPYAFMVATDNMYAWNTVTFELASGNLPDGMILKSTGEIYGTPKEAGEFTFTIRAKHSSEQFAKYPNEQKFTLIVNDNSDTNVYSATDEDYEIKQAIGTEKTPGSFDFYLADATRDQLFSSYADYLTNPSNPQYSRYNFKGLWLNGEKLEQGVDYVAEQGSTVITIRSQTFASKANRNGANTIAMEFRVNGSEDNELKRTAQNFYMDNETKIDSGSSGSHHGSGSSSGSSDSSSGSGSETCSNSSSGNGAAAGAQATGGTYAEVGGANLSIRVMDENGAAMTGVTVVLHSTPRSTVTDGVGRAFFANVEFGQHNIAIVKNGQTIATSQFVLEKSVNTAVSNGAVYCPDGADVAFSVRVTSVGTVTLDNGSAVKLAAGTVASPKTGDDSHLLAWAILLGAAALSTGVLILRAKKQK